MGIDVLVHATIRPDAGLHEFLVKIARHVAQAEGFRAGTLSIAVVGGRMMSRMHREYLGIDGPTDVLTFDLDTRGRRLEGEIILCADVARERVSAATRRAERSRAARKRGSASLRAELALYLAHGILHLAGYEDHTPRGFREMHERENELLGALGLGRVFGDVTAE